MVLSQELIQELNQEEISQKESKTIKFLLQQINDNLSGGLTSRNLTSFRNTYVINAQDSLDDSYPMYVHFNIIDEMIKIVSVKVDFWILNYRAYSKAGVATGSASGGGSTSGSGGGQTSSETSTPSGGADTSGAQGSASGGSSTSGAFGSLFGGKTGQSVIDGETVWTYDEDGVWYVLTVASAEYIQNHTHSTPNHTHPNHTHSTPDHTHPVHTHTVANHTHTTPAHTHPNHTHTAAYGIFEEDTSPTIKFYVSENEGVSYSDVFGGYTIDKSGLDITSLLTKSGSKLIKFTSDVRARLAIQIMVKLDINAR